MELGWDLTGHISFYLAVGQDLFDRWKILIDGALRDGHRRYVDVPLHLIVFGTGSQVLPRMCRISLSARSGTD